VAFRLLLVARGAPVFSPAWLLSRSACLLAAYGALTLVGARSCTGALVYSFPEGVPRWLVGLGCAAYLVVHFACVLLVPPAVLGAGLAAVVARVARRASSGRSARDIANSALLVAALVSLAPVTRAEPGTADRNPGNDTVVAPPDALPDCAERLTRAGIDFGPASLPVRAQGGYFCGAPDVVVYRGSRAGIRWSPAPIVTCGLALALARFDTAAQEEARRVLGRRITRIEQGGTYNCRKMARFDMVSEHSYANAIDVYAFRFDDGRRAVVLRDFGPLTAEPTAAPALFLRSVAHRAYDEGVFSVVLTRFFDELHRNHFHLDMARYRIDGTRPSVP
jgi:hypothetical protein